MGLLLQSTGVKVSYVLAWQCLIQAASQVDDKQGVDSALAKTTRLSMEKFAKGLILGHFNTDKLVNWSIWWNEVCAFENRVTDHD